MDQNRKKIILIVDDDALTVQVIRSILEESDFRLLEAKDANDALKQIASLGGAVDLLLLDVVMPGMNGFQFASTLYSQYPDLKIIFMSGYPDIAQSLSDGSKSTYVNKPFTPQILTKAISQMLNR